MQQSIAVNRDASCNVCFRDNVLGFRILQHDVGLRVGLSSSTVKTRTNSEFRSTMVEFSAATAASFGPRMSNRTPHLHSQSWLRRLPKSGFRHRARIRLARHQRLQCRLDHTNRLHPRCRNPHLLPHSSHQTGLAALSRSLSDSWTEKIIVTKKIIFMYRLIVSL